MQKINAKKSRRSYCKEFDNSKYPFFLCQFSLYFILFSIQGYASPFRDKFFYRFTGIVRTGVIIMNLILRNVFNYNEFSFFFGNNGSNCLKII